MYSTKPLKFIVLLLAAALLFTACGSQPESASSPSSETQSGSSTGTAQPFTIETPESTPSASAQPQPDTSSDAQPVRYNALPLPQEMRAMWISFLEWQAMDISTETAFRAAVTDMFDNCVSMELNTVIVAVRPFSDAMYQSSYYPWSHLITGTQGKDPGFDPLAILVEEAHGRGLRIEAWINPYRVQHPSFGPEVLAESNPAVTHPDWLRTHEGLWLDPGYPEVAELVKNGVVEIVENYDVDGIHFDDYFYPEGNTEAFDAATYAAYGQGKDRSDWRRENVNTMVRNVYAAVKEANPTVSFGVSPQGNNENNYNDQHCDINLWMQEPGYTDYVMPQLYWGFNYIRNGDDKASFTNKVREWLSYPLDEDVRLYAGLGAYRIGDGDYSDNSQGEWQNGHSVADMVTYLREKGQHFNGFALFHYQSLYPEEGSPYYELAAQEAAALTAAIKGEDAAATGSIPPSASPTQPQATETPQP